MAHAKGPIIGPLWIMLKRNEIELNPFQSANEFQQASYLLSPASIIGHKRLK